ncbi:MAG: hypothetical protein U0793_12110 [Gemmataceae bacterium]
MRPQDEMKMVRHETISERPDRQALVGVADELDERLIIAFLVKDLAVGVAAVDNVVAEAAGGGASSAWHRWRIRKRKVECPLFLPQVCLARSSQRLGGNMTGDISYDLVMKDDMDFVEGTYRIGDDEWHVVIASKAPITEVQVSKSEWESGVKGTVIRLPRCARLNKKTLEEIMSRWFGVKTWQEVRGPDSMQLR